MESNHVVFAELFLRLFAGILFVYQGYDKIFRIGFRNVTAVFMDDARRMHVPAGLVNFITYYTSIVEFAGGILLILGLFTDEALYALAAGHLVVAVAFSSVEPMWDLKHVFPRIMLIAVLLLLPDACRQIALDYLLKTH